MVKLTEQQRKEIFKIRPIGGLPTNTPITESVKHLKINEGKHKRKPKSTAVKAPPNSIAYAKNK